MTIKQLKRVFFSELNNLYADNEIDSFFYILTKAYFNKERVDIALELNNEITISKQFHEAINALKEQIPIQYIIGKTVFYDLEFKVSKDVLIPRPETEELVDWIIKSMAKKKQSKPKIIDMGTGSGCIAISLAKNIEFANITALDVSNNALLIAKENAINNNVDIHFIKADILNLKITDNPLFDIIVSNPPYVRNKEKNKMKDNVLKNEPHLALFVSDENPLLFYNAIADFAILNLVKDGLLFFEINQYLAKETKSLLLKKGFSEIELKKDIYGNYRMIKAKR